MKTAWILFFNAKIVERWLLNSTSGLVNTRLYLPSEASLVSVLKLSGPKTTALNPFLTKAQPLIFHQWDQWKDYKANGFNEVCFTMFEEIQNKRRDVECKAFSWTSRRDHQHISTTNISFHNFSLIFPSVIQTKLF